MKCSRLPPECLAQLASHRGYAALRRAGQRAFRAPGSNSKRDAACVVEPAAQTSAAQNTCARFADAASSRMSWSTCVQRCMPCSPLSVGPGQTWFWPCCHSMASVTETPGLGHDCTHARGLRTARARDKTGVTKAPKATERPATREPRLKCEGGPRRVCSGGVRACQRAARAAMLAGARAVAVPLEGRAPLAKCSWQAPRGAAKCNGSAKSAEVRTAGEQAQLLAQPAARRSAARATASRGRALIGLQVAFKPQGSMGRCSKCAQRARGKVAGSRGGGDPCGTPARRAPRAR